MKEIDWDEIREKLRSSISLVADASQLTLKIEAKTEETPKEIPVDRIIESGDQLKELASQFLGHPVEFTAEPLEGGRGILLRFQDEETLQEMHKFMEDLLFGDILKQLVEMIMKALAEALGGGGEESSE